MAHIPPYLTDTLYALHCEHDGHPCEHSYETIGIAINAAYMGLMSGHLQCVYKITRGNRTVVSEEALRQRLSEIAAIPSN